MHPVDATIARFAAAQKELVTRRALLDAGVTGAAIDHRRATGALTPVHRGVYTTARSPLTFEQRALAAVLACGGGAVLGDGWAAGLWRMLTEPPGPPDVRRSGHHRTGPSGVSVRRCAELDRVIHRGVPVTGPGRTLLPLAAVGPIERLEEAMNEALYAKLVTRIALEALAASGHRGSALVRSLLHDTPGYTRQGAERRMRSLILKAQLPPPRLNERIEGHDADAVWPDHKLVLEMDGYAGHGRRRAFEHDRRLDQQRAAAGYRTLRVTWRQLVEEPEAVVARLAATLAR